MNVEPMFRSNLLYGCCSIKKPKVKTLKDDQYFYLNSTLSSQNKDPKGIKIPLLIDTAASHNFIAIETFLQLPDVSHIPVIDYAETASTAGNQNINILSKAALCISVTDVQGQTHQIKINTLICSGLAHAAYLGLTFMRKFKAQLDFTANKITFVQNEVPFTCKMDMRHITHGYVNAIAQKEGNSRPKRSDKCLSDAPHTNTSDCQLNRIQNKTSKKNAVPIQLCAKYNKKIPKNAFVEIHGSVKYGHDLLTDTYVKFTPKSEKRKMLKIHQNIFRIHPDQPFMVRITNDKERPLQVKKGTILGYLEPIQQHFVDSILTATCATENNLTLRDKKVLSIAAIAPRKYCRKKSKSIDKEVTWSLEQDKYLNDQERSDKLAQFQDEGYTEHSSSYTVDKNSSLTEFGSSTKKLSYEELIQQVPLNHLPEKLSQYVREKLWDVKEVFPRWEYDLPAAKCGTFPLKLRVPITDVKNSKYIPIPKRHHEALEQILSEMLESGIISRTYEPCPIISQIILVDKRTSSAKRFVLDQRLTNSLLQNNFHTNANYFELLQFLEDAKHLTTLDLAASFFSLAIRPEDRYLQAFIDHKRRRFVLNRASQGGRCSSAFLETAMDMTLGHINEVMHYADDCLVKSNEDTFHHVDKLMEVLRALRDKNFRIKPSKLKILHQSVEILGFIYEKSRLSMPAIRANAITTLKPPKTLRDARRLLNLFAYWRHLIKDYAKIAAVLGEVIKGSPKKLTWESRHDKALQDMKDAVCNRISICVPDSKRPIYAMTDASVSASGVVFYHTNPDGTVDYIGCHGKVFSAAERARAVPEKEALALNWACQAYKPIIQNNEHPLICFCDARSLLYLKLAKDRNPFITRLALNLSVFDIELRHISSKCNYLADTFSRVTDEQGLPLKAYNTQTMTREEALCVVQQLTIPRNYMLSTEEVKECLTGLSWPSLLIKTRPTKSSVANSKILNTNLVPEKQNVKKHKPPPSSKTHPFYKTQNRDWAMKLHEENIKEHSSTSRQQSAINPRRRKQRTKPSLCALNKDPQTNDSHNKANQTSICFNGAILSDGTISVQDFITAQTCDPFCQEKAAKPSKMFIHRKGLLIYKNKSHERIVLPENLFDNVCFNMHHTVHGIHRTPRKIFESMSTSFYFPNMEARIRKYTDQCFICLATKNQAQTKNVLRKVPYQNRPPPRTTYTFDIALGLPPSNGYVCIYIFVCARTQWVTLVPGKSKSAENIIEATLYHVIAKYGLFDRLFSDQETALEKSHAFKAFLMQHGIQHETTSGYSPWQNATETFVNLTKQALKAICMQLGNSWHRHVPYINVGLNTTVKSGGFTAEQLLFGMSKSMPGDLLRQEIEYANDTDYVKKVQQAILYNLQIADAKREKINDLQRSHANKSRDEKTWKVGTICMLRQMAIQQNSAVAAKYIGPYEIKDIISKTNCVLLQHVNYPNDIRKTHINHIRPVKSDVQKTMLPPNWHKDIVKGLNKGANASLVGSTYKDAYSGPITRAKARKPQ